MFGLETPVEETVFYKEVLHEGEIKGKIEVLLKNSSA